MPVKYRVKTKPDNITKKKSRYYAVPVRTGEVGVRELAEALSKRSSLTVGDIKATLIGLIPIVEQYLHDGYSVRLDNLGLFTLSVSSPGYDNPDDCTPRRVEARRICFRACNELKQRLKKIHFVRDKKESLMTGITSILIGFIMFFTACSNSPQGLAKKAVSLIGKSRSMVYTSNLSGLPNSGIFEEYILKDGSGKIYYYVQAKSGAHMALKYSLTSYGYNTPFMVMAYDFLKSESRDGWERTRENGMDVLVNSGDGVSFRKIYFNGDGYPVKITGDGWEYEISNLRLNESDLKPYFETARSEGRTIISGRGGYVREDNEDDPEYDYDGDEGYDGESDDAGSFDTDEITEYSYLVLEGMLGNDLGIVMEFRNWADGPGDFSGTCYYKKDPEKIELSGRLEPSGQFRMAGLVNSDTTGYWSGTWKDDILEGEWRSGDSSKTLRFRLKRQTRGVAGITYRVKTNNRIEINQCMISTSASHIDTRITEALDEVYHSGSSGEYTWILSSVNLNIQDILSINLATSVDWGGHKNEVKDYFYNFDLKTGQRLYISDLLKDDYEQFLSGRADQEGVHVHEWENVTINIDGLLFTSDWNSVGPPDELFVPFSKLKDYIRPDGVLPRLINIR